MNADITSGWAGAGGATAPPAGPLIQLSDVTKRYDDDGQPALQDVSLDIAPGEAVAVMGPSGSGKSTLLNLIAGLDRPSSGTVTVAGQRIDRLSETGLARFRRQQIGMVFQFFNLLDDLTVADNVLLPAQLAGLSRRQARARVAELLAALRIEQHQDAYPGRLSGGERQRVAIARALVNRPALLLADEPTGALDTATGEEIGALLRDLNAAGHTLVLVTHNPDLAGHYASRTVHIADGLIFSRRQPPRRQPARRPGGGAAMRPGPVGTGRRHAVGPVGRAVRGGVARRRVQTVVIGLVLLVSTGASVLALALVVDSSAPFDHSFAAQHGAHLAAVVDPARATPAELAATTRLRQVTASAGPFAAVSIAPQLPGPAGPGGSGPPMTLAGRSAPGGRVDDLTLQSGHWADRPGQLVLAVNSSSDVQIGLPLGAKITVTSAPGHPVLTVVGEATSVTNSADGWVTPGEIARLHTPGAPRSVQMLYRFRSAGTAAAVHADTAAVSAALPPGAVTATQSYLTVREQETSRIGPFVPFLVAFGVIGLVMSVLIVANVVSGAVVAGYRRIGILKSIGFTPGQVVAAYTAQVAVPAVVGVLGGLILGALLATMLLRQAANAYGVGRSACRYGSAWPCPRRCSPWWRSRPCCRPWGRRGSARSRPSRRGGRRGPAAATPRTGCSAGCGCPGR